MEKIVHLKWECEGYFILLLKRPFQCPDLNAKLVQTSEDVGFLGSPIPPTGQKHSKLPFSAMV